jgi:hypothetical protein
MVAFIDSKESERRACRYQSILERFDRRLGDLEKLTFCCCSSHSEHENLHRHRSLAITLSVDVCNYACVVREVSWLRHARNNVDSCWIVEMEEYHSTTVQKQAKPTT